MIEVLKIKNYKGYYMKDELAKIKPSVRECLLVNLQDNAKNVFEVIMGKNGTHHLALWKNGDDVRYFDSYGCPIPKEIEEYYKDFHIKFYRSLDNKFPDKLIQELNSTICGELSVLFLFLCKNYSFEEIIKALE
jgi:hypothetical protein